MTPPVDTPDHDLLTTLVVAIAAGVFLVALARRTNLPAIVMLLGGGVLLGHEGLGVVVPESLGQGLLIIVELAIGLILFEGGLTLEPHEYRTAPNMIKRLLTAGVLITWLTTTLCLHLVIPLPWEHAFIAASLVIVTGPTVISPLLKRLRIPLRLRSVLHWEGVLIDPIGVFIAVLCFEWVAEAGGPGALLALAYRVASGLAIGGLGGVGLTVLVRSKVVPREVLNAFALGWAVLVFGAAERAMPKSGLLAVTLAGFVFGLTRPAGLEQIRRFKAEITDLLIGMLFILLAARLSFDQFQAFGLRGALVVVVVMVLIRPLSIGVCSFGLDFTRREKIFLSWIAPRGIVAASMASLFALSLEQRGMDTTRFVESFTYSVIVATIVLQGLSAAPLARLLGLEPPARNAWLVVGAHALARRFARFVKREAGRPVILVDTNAAAVRAAQAEGLTVVRRDAREKSMAEEDEFAQIGRVLAFTDNEDLNIRLCQVWSDVVGDEHLHRCDPGGTGSAEDDDGTTGRVVWSELGRPSLVAGEIERGHARVRTTRALDGVPAGATVLAWFDGKDLRLDPPPAEIDEGDELRILYLARPQDYLGRSLRTALVLDSAAPDLRALLEEAIGKMVELAPALPREKTVEELLERETVFPTLLGNGVAVPHAHSRDLTERLCAVVRVPDGVRFVPSADPVRLVFVLLSPAGDPEGHLATLAEIARTVSAPGAIELLMDASSPAEVLHLVGAVRTPPLDESA